MVVKFTSKANTIYFINMPTMLHILEGSGTIQVDFKMYFDWQDKIIFLEKGQHIKFSSSNFIVRKIEFKDEVIFSNKNIRVLFKHLVSLGYINFAECIDCQNYLNNSILLQPKDIIDVSSEQWFWQNPFNANLEEYHIIFDIKDVIDREYKNHLTNMQLSALINHNHINPLALFTNKVGITVKNLLGNKRFVEVKKEIAFSAKSVKEIAYDFGYKDPAYFNRLFKQNVGVTPIDFRKEQDVQHHDYFVQELYELLHAFHTKQRSVKFYAQKMHLSEKAFSKKVKDKLQISVGQLIRQQLIVTAKKLLQKDTVNEVAFRLGFEEPNHFSSFFKHYTNTTPTQFQNKKYKF